MSKETFGLIVMFLLSIGFLVISWQLQDWNLLLGYTFGVFGVLISVGIGLDIMTREEK